jgi:hypothetical protein
MSQDFDSPESVHPNEPKRTAPRLTIPVPPNLPIDDPDQGSPHRRLSTMVGLNFLLTLISLPVLGYLLYHHLQPPPPPPGNPTASASPDGAKSLASDVDRLKTELASVTRKLGESPASADPGPRVKSLDDKVAELSKTVAEMPARLDSLSQKVGAAPQVDAIDKKVGELARTVDTIKAEVTSRPTPAGGATAAAPTTQPAQDSNAEEQAMEQAAELFKQGKFAEARDAFTRIQSANPDDARVFYYAALANGLANRNWQGESERLVKAGLEKEKAGSPDRAKIDATFAGLTTATGKDWLAYFRKQAGH